MGYELLELLRRWRVPEETVADEPDELGPQRIPELGDDESLPMLDGGVNVTRERARP